MRMAKLGNRCQDATKQNTTQRNTRFWQKSAYQFHGFCRLIPLVGREQVAYKIPHDPIAILLVLAGLRGGHYHRRTPASGGKIL
jgi:hypothetical protein